MAQLASHPPLLTALPRSLLPAPQHPLGRGLDGRHPLQSSHCRLPTESRRRTGRSGLLGVFWGILWRVGEPQVRGGGEGSPCSGQGPSVGAAMAGGAGPRPTAPAVSLSDELHAIRRC